MDYFLLGDFKLMHQQNINMDTPDSEMIVSEEENAADSKTEERKLDAHPTCMVNSLIYKYSIIFGYFPISQSIHYNVMMASNVQISTVLGLQLC